MKIVICDDNKKHLEFIKKTIKDIIAYEEYDMEVVCVEEDPYKILDFIKNKKESEPYVYFLDVDLKSDINGINLGESIREYDARGFIVYITTRAEMSYLTFKYKVEALDYIIKDNMEEIKKNIQKSLEVINERYKQNNDERKDTLFNISSDNRNISIDFKDILFFETSPNVHRVIIHSNNRILEFYGKLKDIESKLDDRFVRCHKAYIVNLDNIKEIDKKNRVIYMNNEEECYASVRLMKPLEKKLNDRLRV